MGGFLRSRLAGSGRRSIRRLERALRWFQSLDSIEYDPETYVRAVKRFTMYVRRGKVRIHQGLSADVLPELIDPTVPTVFWLDAHYSGGTFTYDEKWAVLPQCSVLDELQIIGSFSWQAEVVILLDDAFMFEDHFWNEDPRVYTGGVYVDGFRREDWPTMRQIWDALPGWDFGRRSWDVVEIRRAA